MVRNIGRQRSSEEQHTVILKQELGLKDLVLMQFVCVVSTTWLAVAGKAGQAHVLFWIAASVMFHLPLVLVISHLHRQTPLEGGLYQWTGVALGSTAAFMVGWNLWLFSVISTGLVGLQVATYGSYLFGQTAAWMLDSTWFRLVSIGTIIALLTTLNTLGLSAGRWIHNASGVALALTCFILIVLPLVQSVSGAPTPALTSSTPRPASWSFDLNLLGKLGFGAFCGFEYVAIMSAECREPRRTIVQSIWIASVGVTAVYILGTAAVLVFVPSAGIDSTSPIAQVLTVGLQPFGAARHIVPAALCALLLCSIGGGSVNFTSATRLPMVMGWNAALPAWFSRQHSRYKTPVNAIAATASLALLAGVTSVIGVRNEESFQLILNAALMCYALAYLVMFALPLIGRRRGARREVPPAGTWLKLAALSGFVMTLLFVFTAIFPIIDVASTAGFSGRVLAMFVAGNAVGAALAFARRRTDDALEPRVA